MLIISHNELTYLPQSILNLKHLTFLDVSVNKLSYLPASLCKLKITHIDISINLFSNNQNCFVFNLNMPSLAELSAKTIIDRRFVASFLFLSFVYPRSIQCINANNNSKSFYRLKYDPGVIPYIVLRYLDTANYCVNCRGACFDCYIKEITYSIPHVLLATIVIKTTEILQFECYYCSTKCRTQYHQLLNELNYYED